MNILLFDSPSGHVALKPFTLTRPIAHIRIGILTIQKKWEYYFDSVSPLSPKYLQQKFPPIFGDSNYYVNAQALPTAKLAKKIGRLKEGEALFSQGELLAFCSSHPLFSPKELLATAESAKRKNLKAETAWIHQKEDLFKLNRSQIISDFKIVTKGRKSAEISDPHTVVYGHENVFVEEGAQVRCAILNATEGPIYIGKDAHVHEGAIIKGAFALCKGAHLNMGAKIKGDTTIGPYCKVGGEVSNSVIFGYSNKGHDGFLGNSVLGEWCNLGADTNTSNLKNNYGPVSVWNYTSESIQPTQEQFYGLMMGDHSKAGINTMFNTGTVVGVCANIFGGDFPQKFIPSFSWGGQSFTEFKLEKAYEVAERMMGRRKVALTKPDKKIFAKILKESQKFRK